VHSKLRDNVNAFGFAPDYVPFFTIDVRETNAFERALTLAQTRLRLAREREDLAISSDRSFETDAAEFQAELVRIRNTYESQLRELCGSVALEGDDGAVVDVVPATRDHAHRDPRLATLGDPCGFVGNGDIHNALGQVELARLDVQRILQQMENVRSEVDIEVRRIGQQCGCPGAKDSVVACGESCFAAYGSPPSDAGATWTDLAVDAIQSARSASALLGLPLDGAFQVALLFEGVLAWYEGAFNDFVDFWAHLAPNPGIPPPPFDQIGWQSCVADCLHGGTQSCDFGRCAEADDACVRAELQDCWGGAAADVPAQCSEQSLRDLARQRITLRGDQRVNLEQDIRENQFISARIQSGVQLASTLTQAAGCSAFDGSCAVVGVVTAAYAITHVAAELGVAALERQTHSKELELIQMQEADAQWDLDRQCQLAELDSNARVETTLLRLKELELEALRGDYQMRLALSETSRLFNRAQKLQLEQDEARQMAINVAAARNDPNIRIYRNDAVINADVAFDAAMRDAYRATLVFEYYTSQSYARRGDLFLIRLIACGERNLEDYLADLQNAFIEFEEEFGLPSLRLLKISLRDDIFRIRLLDDEGKPFSESDRTARLQAKLRNPALLDRRGYLSIPFQTRLDVLSPATRNHKVHHVLAEINGDPTNEGSARLYLVQGGTSQIASVDGERLYYRFPPVTAVLNARVGNGQGEAGVDPAIYDNYRLRDRPMVATDWRLVLNQRDEAINQDLDLSTVTDILLFVYYTDFTEY
jgi:hypothetical protein